MSKGHNGFPFPGEITEHLVNRLRHLYPFAREVAMHDDTVTHDGNESERGWELTLEWLQREVDRAKLRVRSEINELSGTKNAPPGER